MGQRGRGADGREREALHRPPGVCSAPGVMPRISSVPSGPRLMTQMANCDNDQVVYRDSDRAASAAPIESADVKHPQISPSRHLARALGPTN
jgi:hypothetical protein